jgi:hypothetical protein
VLDKLTSNSVDGARLVCDESDWKWVTKLGDLGQKPEDKLISEVQGQDREFFPPTSADSPSYANHRTALATDNPGYYLSQHFSVMVPSEKLKTGYGGGLCTDSSADGETWASAKFVMICNRAFDKYTTTLNDMISGQDSIASGTSLDEQQTVGAVFLHEMMHWINKQSKPSIPRI